MSSHYGSPEGGGAPWTCAGSALAAWLQVAAVSLTLLKCDISVHGCSPYVKLSNICECLSTAITAYCGLSKLYQKYSYSLT